MQVKTIELRDDEKGLLDKLDKIAELIQQGKQNINIRLHTLSLIQHLNDMDYESELINIYNWVCKNIRYVRDIENIELIHDADKVLEFESGDCDDFAILLGAMLGSVGFPVQLVIASNDGVNWEHIYIRTNLNNQWIVCDASMKFELNKEVDAKYRKYFLVH